MNTAKLFGRDNVSLAIRGARIRFALGRIDQQRRFDRAHAEAACNIALDALSAERPMMPSIVRFGLPLFEETRPVVEDAVVTRDPSRAVVGEIDGPVASARVRAYENLRLDVDRKGGVEPFSACRDVRGLGDAKSPRFEGTFSTRSGSVYRATMAEEGGILRLSAVRVEGSGAH